MAARKHEPPFVPELETVFLLPSQSLSFVSSSLIKDVALHDGDISSFLPPVVAEAMLKKLNKFKLIFDIEDNKRYCVGLV